MTDKTKPPDGWRPRAAPESGSAVSANTGTNSPASTSGQPTYVLRLRPIAGVTADSVLTLRRPLKTAPPSLRLALHRHRATGGRAMTAPAQIIDSTDKRQLLAACRVAVAELKLNQFAIEEVALTLSRPHIHAGRDGMVARERLRLGIRAGADMTTNADHRRAPLSPSTQPSPKPGAQAIRVDAVP